jgi:hypothetical protein
VPVAYSEPSGPSEFTRVVAVSQKAQDASASSLPTPQTSTPARSDAPQPKTNAPSYLTLILVMNGLFLLAILLVVYFIVKK